MNDFDRKLAICIGLAASTAGILNRDIIAICYKETSLLLRSTESSEVSEKWIDFLTDRLSDLRVVGRKSEQIAKDVFEKIAKT